MTKKLTITIDGAILMGAKMKRGEVWWVSFEPMPQGVRRTRPEVGTATALKKRRLFL